MSNEKYYKIYIRPHHEAKGYGIVSFVLYDTKDNDSKEEIEVSFNLDFFMESVEERYRAWFIANVARHYIDPVIEENKWEIEDGNNYLELVKEFESLWNCTKDS